MYIYDVLQFLLQLEYSNINNRVIIQNVDY